MLNVDSQAKYTVLILYLRGDKNIKDTFQYSLYVPIAFYCNAILLIYASNNIS